MTDPFDKEKNMTQNPIDTTITYINGQPYEGDELSALKTEIADAAYCHLADEGDEDAETISLAEAVMERLVQQGYQFIAPISADGQDD